MNTKLLDQREYWRVRGMEYYQETINSGFLDYEMFFQDMLIDELKNLEFDSCLEAGSGYGWNIERVRREFPQVRVNGLDFSLPQLENSLKYSPLTSIVCGDVCDMPFGDNAFDVVFSMGVLMNIHPSKIEQAVGELIRVTKKYIIHLEWDENNTKPELKELRASKSNIIPHDYRKLYKTILKFKTYKDFEEGFYHRFTPPLMFGEKRYEGPEKYILAVIRNEKDRTI